MYPFVTVQLVACCHAADYERCWLLPFIQHPSSKLWQLDPEGSYMCEVDLAACA